MNEMEIRPIPGFLGYGASQDGRIWSIKSGQWLEIKASRGSHRPGSQGYLKVGIGPKRSRVSRLVHTLIASTFLGPKPEGMQHNHKDGNTCNNAASNLEYVSQSENMAHAFSHGLNVHPHGSSHPMARLNERQVRAIRAAYEQGGASIHELAEGFSVSRRCIADIVHGRTWAGVA